MSVFSCVIELSDYNDLSLYLYRSIGGQPKLIVPTLAEALGLGRRGLTVQDYAARIAAVLGPQGVRSLSIHPNADPLVEFRYNYLYSITFGSRILCRVYEISDGGDRTLQYEGLLDNYLTKELRKPRARRGRIPPGCLDKAEQAEAESVPKTRAEVRREILAEREVQGIGLLPDLRGVRIASARELAERRLARRRRQKK